ncbi:MAG: uracil-DNA glycosylase [Acidiferrobacteraceae bacterium]
MKPFHPGCRACPRIVRHLESVRRRYPDYHCAPVPSFGDRCGRLWIVGLAPGLHGANATGRPFTGDFAGQLLYQTLHESGYASAPCSLARDDGLVLSDCYITNAVKCLPPENRPLGEEVRRCNCYLEADLRLRPPGTVILALGGVAHAAVVRALGLRAGLYPFGHGTKHRLGSSGWLVDSYHCSRYNQHTKRLVPDMFRRVIEEARILCSKATGNS